MLMVQDFYFQLHALSNFRLVFLIFQSNFYMLSAFNALLFGDGVAAVQAMSTHRHLCRVLQRARVIAATLDLSQQNF
jgi:hypothetical protein